MLDNLFLTVGGACVIVLLGIIAMVAKWYRKERFPRVSVSRGMIRGRKMLSMSGWAKHGAFWEFTDLPEGEFTFEPRFIEADRNKNWQGRHVLEYVTHAPGSPHAGRLVWPMGNG